MSTRARFTAIIASVLIAVGGCSKEPAPLPAPSGPSPADTGAAWPRFHGPAGDNISTETGLLAKWPSGGPKLIWAVDGIGNGFSSVSIADGRIFTDGNIDDTTTITALDLNGQIQWQAKNGPAYTGSHAGTRGTPTIDGNRLYHESPMGQVACFDAATGDEVWSRNILNAFEAENIKWALAESLLVDGDRVICCPFGGKGSVVALDKQSGATVWAAPPVSGGAGYASPVVAEHGDLRMILTMSGNALVGVDADSGDLLFERKHVTQYDVNATMPIYHDGHVFVTSGYGTGSELLKLDAKGEKVALQSVWKSSELDNQHGGVIFWGGHIYGASHGGHWLCIEWKTGQAKYKEKGIGKGSIAMADGMLYLYNEKRKLALVSATPDGLDIVSSFSIPSGGEGPTWAHPVICGGCLYIRHSDRLYAYDVRGEQTVAE